MNTPQKDQQKGFTIIEVVLVLAIAGLIFLMVFVALPALQRGQRDAQRKQDLSRIQVQMTNYLSSTRGSVPNSSTGLTNFVKGYLGGTTTPTEAGPDYKDPNGDNYNVKYQDAPGAPGEIGYYDKSSCKPENADGIATGGASRDFAFTMKLENQTAVYCIDSKS